ncbi:hypothetical protein BDR06DRAFT_971120 [Suillus hirtellus]|nr:hypothetical protein BDR06DRAFT_971120 [Suillus hirtellus]
MNPFKLEKLVNITLCEAFTEEFSKLKFCLVLKGVKWSVTSPISKLVTFHGLKDIGCLSEYVARRWVVASQDVVFACFFGRSKECILRLPHWRVGQSDTGGILQKMICQLVQTVTKISWKTSNPHLLCPPVRLQVQIVSTYPHLPLLKLVPSYHLITNCPVSALTRTLNIQPVPMLGRN